MATISLADASTRTQFPSRASNVKVPYLVEKTINFADAVTAKGSGLAAADVIEAIRIPAETIVLAAGFEVVTAVTGGTSDQAVQLGDGVDPNRWVDTTDLDAATAGTHGTIVIATANPTVFASADTIDLTISAATTVGTGAVIRVYAVMVDASNAAKPGLAALKS